MCEVWRPVVGFEWGYEVSNFGNVRSIDRVIRQKTRWGGYCDRQMKGKVLSPSIDKNPKSYSYGRKSVGLGVSGGGKKDQKTRLVSHLVAEAFIGPRPLGMECCHNNGISGDNRVENLRYDTPIANTLDKYEHGTIRKGSDCNYAKLRDEDVIAIRALCGRVTYEKIGEMFGISIAQVSRIKNRKRWAHIT